MWYRPDEYIYTWNKGSTNASEGPCSHRRPTFTFHQQVLLISPRVGWQTLICAAGPRAGSLTWSDLAPAYCINTSPITYSSFAFITRSSGFLIKSGEQGGVGWWYEIMCCSSKVEVNRGQDLSPWSKQQYLIIILKTSLFVGMHSELLDVLYKVQWKSQSSCLYSEVVVFTCINMLIQA